MRQIRQENSKSRLGDFFRRLAYRKGRSVAITATARKICVFIYTMLTTKQSFCYELSQEETQKIKTKKIKNIVKSLKGHDISKYELETAWF